MNKSDYLRVGLEAAGRASEVTLRYFENQDFQVETKEDGSPATIADREAEEIIKSVIKENFADHGILGEEEGKIDSKSEYRWIIDPIDGTLRFIRKIPLFGTLIALEKNGEIIMGICYMPIINEILWAETGKGAYFNDEKIQVSEIADVGQAYTSLGGTISFERHHYLANLLALEKDTRYSRAFGDIWGFSLLAQGKVDVHMELGVKYWDIAAHKIIIEEAGGKMTDLKGGPITSKTDGVIATNSRLHERILGYFVGNSI